ncbi:MAG: NPCBM/NEW2 domain-containing protein [Planctomycetia bacterium]|nr:NPCBM/NEW2 domain-containing protein [Planctomycetia bacterium]
MAVCLGWVFSSFLQAESVTVQTLSGETISGTWESVLPSGIRIRVEGDAREFSWETLARVQFSGEKAEKNIPFLLLRDGSFLGTPSGTLQEGIFHDGEGEKERKIPLAEVKAVLFQPIALRQPEIRKAWEEILTEETSQDTLVALRDGKISHYRGEIREIQAETVPFWLDGEAIPIKRERILGLRFADLPEAKKFPAGVAILTDRRGNRYSVGKFQEGNASEIIFSLRCGEIFRLPVSEMVEMECTGGTQSFLRVADAESVKWLPFVSVPGMEDGREAFFAPKDGRSLNGSALSIGGKTYSHGFTASSRTELVFRLPDDARRFQAVVGMDDEVRPQGNVRLVIHADEKELFSGEITGSMPPQELDLEVAGASRLKILVDYGKNMDISDHLNFGNARILP